MCFSSFIINKALGRKWEVAWVLRRERTRLSAQHFAGVVQGLYFQMRHREVIILPPAKNRPDVPMFLLCSIYAALICQCFFSPFFAPDSSSGSHLRARDEPSSNHIRHGETITAGPFLVMVCSPNDRPTGCVRSGCVCLLSLAAIPARG